MIKKFNRAYSLDKLIDPKRVLVLYGPRRVGKTTLVKSFLTQFQGRYLFELGDSLPFQQILSSFDPQQYRQHFSHYDLLVIDEAQSVPQIGRALKLLVDLELNLPIIATGSSSFELSGQVGEPLTGRKWELLLYPLSYYELKKQLTYHELKQSLPTQLIYGFYPEVFATDNLKQKRKLLMELVASYLFKDILALENLRSPQVLLNLLKLLAFQIGNEVSLSELATRLGIDYKTVQRYLDLLEKSFVIYELSGLSRNLRNEISKKKKYYFVDVGVRNAVIEQFQPLDKRNDVGQLWENFLVMERIKKQTYLPIYAHNYFWRTWEGKEIDFIEEKDGVFFAYEFKWSTKKKPKAPELFLDTYQTARFQVVTPDNYFEFIS